MTTPGRPAAPPLPAAVRAPLVPAGGPPALGGRDLREVLRLSWRPYRFALPQPLQTARDRIAERRGWLLRLQDPDGGVGWGEAVAWTAQEASLHRALAALEPQQQRGRLERRLAGLPAPLAFALGAALAELDGWLGERGEAWRPAPASAWLLPAGEAALAAVAALLAEAPGTPPPSLPPTFKWKVAAGEDGQERRLLERLLELLPGSARLRLDANGGWGRSTAAAWADRLAADPRLDWLEQPLAPDDRPGLEALAARLPVALDESLREHPEWCQGWHGWQVRRPSLEGDPRPLLAALRAGTPRLMLSTAFETGIGRRWLAHLAALQLDGPTPAAPGLAPGWRPAGDLFSADPERVWAAAAAP
ncbi:MAG: enolase C-terminal domain-like protein [Synechococcaceae cyanobacterium]|nr:enolase C-terminal domain-like protein [Synechococcaceae cyanobacterium]